MSRGSRDLTFSPPHPTHTSHTHLTPLLSVIANFTAKKLESLIKPKVYVFVRATSVVTPDLRPQSAHSRAVCLYYVHLRYYYFLPLS